MIDLQKEILVDTHRLIPLPCCNSTQFLMIDIFTDGGALHQGSSKAIAAYGAIFPQFEKHNFTTALFQATNYRPTQELRCMPSLMLSL